MNYSVHITHQLVLRYIVKEFLKIDIHYPYGEERNSINDFIANANRFIDIHELTPEIVHAFVSKIYVYEKKEKWSRTEGNDIDIVFTVGFREQHTVRTSDAIASSPTETEIPRQINASVLPPPISPL